MKRQFWILLFVSLILGTGWQVDNGRLLITEIYYDTPGDDSLEEWIEIANVGTAVVDLSKIKIGDEDQPGGPEGMNRFPEGALIEPGQVIIVAQSAADFHNLFGVNPDYELSDSDPNVPDMRRYRLWSSGDIGLNNDGDELLLLDANNQLLDSLNYGDSTTYFAPSIQNVLRGQSLARLPADCNTGTAADWQPLEFPTPGEISLEGECTASLNPVELETLLPIGAVQGAADDSSRINETVSFRGIVTGSYEDRNARGIIFYTLFVQDLPGSEDGDPATSDGIAIFLGRERPSAQIGDQVRVSGQVTEFYGFTEIDDNGLEILVEESDRLLPDPIPINPPADNADQAAYFEPLEAMRVTIGGEAQVIGPTFSGCSFAVVGPDVTAAPILRQTIEDPVGQIIPILHNSDVDCAGFPNVKSGDMVTGLVGPLSYNFNQFKLVQQFPEDLDITAATLTPIPIPSKLNDNQISIATFNVENHFDNIDDTGDDAEPKPSAAEISLKQSKIAYQIHNVLGCPTLIGIQEVENETLLLQLTAELTEPCSFTYEVSHQESADGRGIDVALLSNPNDAVVQDAVLQQTCTQIQTGISDDNIDCPPGQDPLFSRPPLQVDLEIGGRPFTIFINHLKSKRGGERETAPRRLLQALHLNDQVTELLAADPEAAVVVLGDFNDYELSPAMLEMTENGRLHNTLSSIPLPQRYSFIFSGAAQLLDSILVSPALVESVASVAIHHVNADYPDSLTADAASPYKATDHDLPIIILNLQTEPEATAVPTLTAVPSPTSTPIPPSSPSTEPSGFNMLWLLGLGGLLIGGTAVYFLRRR